MKYPVVICNKTKLLNNVNKLSDILHAQGRTFAAVTKCICEAEPVFQVLENSNCDWIADSRIENLSACSTSKPRFLIRLAQKHEIPEVIQYSDISFQSEVATIIELSKEAAKQDKIHGIIVALDMGDLREGCFFKNLYEIEKTVACVLQSPNLKYLGIGTNLGCFGGVKTDIKNMKSLLEIGKNISAKFNVEQRYVSGISTGAQKMIFDNSMPREINLCRMGEAWLVGYDSVNHCPVPYMHRDVFTYRAQIIEIKQKPSKPIGEIGGDAMGKIIQREDQGNMLRGIIASGFLDINYEDIIPADGRLKILGGSSDHTIIDMSLAPEYKVGDIVEFNMNYTAVMRAYTSKYVYKQYV